jgi:hypothetical protein
MPRKQENVVERETRFGEDDAHASGPLPGEICGVGLGRVVPGGNIPKL